MRKTAFTLFLAIFLSLTVTPAFAVDVSQAHWQLPSSGFGGGSRVNPVDTVLSYSELSALRNSVNDSMKSRRAQLTYAGTFYFITMTSGGDTYWLCNGSGGRYRTAEESDSSNVTTTTPSTSAPHISENNSSPGSGSSGGYIPSHFGKNTEKEILQQIAQYTHEIWFWADLINDNLKDVRRYTHMVYANIGRFVDGMNNITTGIYKQIDLLSGYLPRLDDIYNRLFNIQSALWASVDVENRIYSAVAGFSPCLDILSEISATLNNYFALTMQQIPEEYSDLPVGYTEVEYIKSTGGQYIDTGYSVGNTTSISMSFSDLVPSSEYSMLFGAANSFGGVPFGNRIVYHANDKKFSIGVSDVFLMFDAFDFHSRADILFSNSGSSFSLMVRGSEPRSLTGSFSSTFPDATLYIFTQNDMGRPDGSFAAMRLYSFAILADGVPVRNFLPCIDPAGSVGLYDLIYNKFYPNLGSGVFVAGAEVHRYHYNYESFLQKISVDLDSFLSGFTVTADLAEVTTRLDTLIANSTAKVENVTNVVIEETNNAYNVFYVTTDDGDKKPVGEVAGDTLSASGKLLNFLYKLCFEGALSRVDDSITNMDGFYFDSGAGLEGNIWD